jgi:hypothetical protein
VIDSNRILTKVMNEGGSLAASVGHIIGVGSGRGTALAFVLVGLMILAITVVAFSNARLRRVELEIPDAEIKVR